jgi:hypothetical protein
MRMQPVSITRRLRNEALTALIAGAPLHFADVAGYAKLNKEQRLELFRALLKAKEHFDFRNKNVKDIPKITAATALFNGVSNDLRRTANFADLILDSLEMGSDGKPKRSATPQGNRARRLLHEAGERWERKQIEARAELPPGLAPLQPVPGFPHSDAADFIESFLRAARVMHSIIEMAKAPPAKLGFEGRAVNFQNSPTDWLVGEKLPEIYSRTFGIEFTATPKSAHHADSSDGIKFVRAACLAMGLTQLAQMSDHTIKVHWQTVRKGSSLGAD